MGLGAKPTDTTSDHERAESLFCDSNTVWKALIHPTCTQTIVM